MDAPVEDLHRVGDLRTVVAADADELKDAREALAGRGDVFKPLFRLLTAVLHGGDRLVRFGLDGADEVADLLRCALGFFRELSDLVSDDGEALALLTCARRFDRGVEREQIRLLGDAGDRRDDLADFLRALTELFDDLRRLVDRLGDRVHLLGRRASGR